MVRAQKSLTRWSASFKWGGYWHVVKRSGRTAYFGPAATARAAARDALSGLTANGYP